MLVYKIHPSIGVARVGDHPTEFFIGPESPGATGVEINSTGAEAPVKEYKAGGQIKRQAARFRIFEYDSAPVTGLVTLKREITENEATIEWKVDLVNRKGALDQTPAHPIDPHSAGRPRNLHLTGDARKALVIRDPRDRKISGKDVGATPANPAVAFDQGTFLTKLVFLGELRTDKQGRLLVLGGRGKAESVPPGKSVGVGPGQNRFANNDFWYDDVSDGPVTATITFPGQAPHPVEAPAWVVVGPPDYAPGIGGVVTLYDVVFQACIDAGLVKASARPSFRRDIMPVIQRAANLRFINDFDTWESLPRNFTDLTKPDASAATIRKAVVDFLMPPNISGVIHDAVIPKFVQKYFTQYESGDFVNDLAQQLPETPVPDQLDRASLEGGVGHSFFPGIEASFNLRDKSIYSEAFRIKHSPTGVGPGFLTEIMAVPWQSDFLKCQMDSLAWWPSQRPDIVMRDKANIPGSQVAWDQRIGSHKDMVEKFGSLTFVVPETVGQDTVFVQEEP